MSALADDEALPPIARPLWLGKATNQSTTEKEIAEAAEAMEHEPGYARNGWTPETLAAYFKERKVAQSDFVLHRRPTRPTRTNGWHNAHRWRR